MASLFLSICFLGDVFSVPNTYTVPSQTQLTGNGEQNGADFKCQSDHLIDHLPVSSNSELTTFKRKSVQSEACFEIPSKIMTIISSHSDETIFTKKNLEGMNFSDFSLY